MPLTRIPFWFHQPALRSDSLDGRSEVLTETTILTSHIDLWWHPIAPAPLPLSVGTRLLTIRSCPFLLTLYCHWSYRPPDWLRSPLRGTSTFMQRQNGSSSSTAGDLISDLTGWRATFHMSGAKATRPLSWCGWLAKRNGIEKGVSKLLCAVSTSDLLFPSPGLAKTFSQPFSATNCDSGWVAWTRKLSHRPVVIHYPEEKKLLRCSPLTRMC